MQLAVPEVADLDGETAETLRRSTASTAPRRPTSAAPACSPAGCSSAASGSSSSSPAARSAAPGATGTATKTCKQNHGQEALRIDRPVAGLLRDLRRRGLLDDTLVLFTTEFGRTPFTQSAADVVGTGRDHNQYGFSVWLAGAGLKHGIAYGATDEIGWKAAENPVTWHDFHATVLHLLGHRPRAADLLPQRHPAPPDERPRRGHQADPRVRSIVAQGAASSSLLEVGSP